MIGPNDPDYQDSGEKKYPYMINHLLVTQGIFTNGLKHDLSSLHDRTLAAFIRFLSILISVIWTPVSLGIGSKSNFSSVDSLMKDD